MSQHYAQGTTLSTRGKNSFHAMKILKTFQNQSVIKNIKKSEEIFFVKKEAFFNEKKKVLPKAAKSRQLPALGEQKIPKSNAPRAITGLAAVPAIGADWL